MKIYWSFINKNFMLMSWYHMIFSHNNNNSNSQINDIIIIVMLLTSKVQASFIVFFLNFRTKQKFNKFIHWFPLKKSRHQPNVPDVENWKTGKLKNWEKLENSNFSLTHFSLSLSCFSKHYVLFYTQKHEKFAYNIVHEKEKLWEIFFTGKKCLENQEIIDYIINCFF